MLKYHQEGEIDSKKKLLQRESFWIYTIKANQLALCTAAQLPEFKPAPCFLSAIIGPID